MKGWRDNRCALSMLAIASLASCGGSQPPIGAPRAMPQSRALATRAERGGSWMAPEAKSEDLLYVADPNEGYVRVFTLRRGKLVGELKQAEPEGACVDSKGDVFVPSGDRLQILVYRHDGTLKRILMAPYNGSFSCSVDPTTGNLAVTTLDRYGGGGISIYQHALGNPTIYTDSSFLSYFFCGYDDLGNLFVDGRNPSRAFVLGELPKGGTTISNVTLSSSIAYPGQVQWDGKYLAIADASTNTISRFSVSGSRGVFKGSTLLGGNIWHFLDFWIHGSGVVTSALRIFNGYGYTQVRYYRYPTGGNPTQRVFRKPFDMEGVTVSSARR